MLGNSSTIKSSFKDDVGGLAKSNHNSKDLIDELGGNTQTHKQSLKLRALSHA